MTDWVVEITNSMGYFGIALLMLLENVFPPIPSEVIMPLAGFGAARGEMTLWGAILAGTVGSLAGATAWYVAGRLVGRERITRWAEEHGRWLGVGADDVQKASDWFHDHGGWAVLVGRLVPAVRTLISLPAGFSEMPVPQFLLYSLIGTVGWTALLAWLGWVLGDNYEKVEQWLGPVSWVVVGVLVLGIGWWILKRRRERGAGG